MSNVGNSLAITQVARRSPGTSALVSLIPTPAGPMMSQQTALLCPHSSSSFAGLTPDCSEPFWEFFLSVRVDTTTISPANLLRFRSSTYFSQSSLLLSRTETWFCPGDMLPCGPLSYTGTMGFEEGYLSPASSLLFPLILKLSLESNFLRLTSPSSSLTLTPEDLLPAPHPLKHYS